MMNALSIMESLVVILVTDQTFAFTDTLPYDTTFTVAVFTMMGITGSAGFLAF